eukprot:1142006-Pelagomonas_calceolata.AAC.4
MYGVLLHGEVRRAARGLASQWWVPGRADGWEIQRGADWCLIVWVGALEGGFWGWWVGQGGSTQKFDMTSTTFFCPPAQTHQKSLGKRVEAEAAKQTADTLKLEAVEQMPANNFLLVFKRS